MRLQRHIVGDAAAVVVHAAHPRREADVVVELLQRVGRRVADAIDQALDAVVAGIAVIVHAAPVVHQPPAGLILREDVPVEAVDAVEAVVALAHVVDAAVAAHVLQVHAVAVRARPSLVVVELAQRRGVQAEACLGVALVDPSEGLLHIELGGGEAVGPWSDAGLRREQNVAHRQGGQDGVDALGAQIDLLRIDEGGVVDALDHVLALGLGMCLPGQEQHDRQQGGEEWVDALHGLLAVAAGHGDDDLV